MSRSRPDAHEPNPASRWYEWHGEKGAIQYYDKATKRRVDVGTTFDFLLLDQLGSVGGWHDASDSSIYANAIKDVRSEILVVKAHKFGVLAEGRWAEIKDKVNASGGHYEAQCYIGIKDDDGGLSIACLRFKGAALHAWAEFTRAHRADLYQKAIRITGVTEGQKGRITYRVPTFALGPVSAATHQQAVALDATFQDWLERYLKRPKGDESDQRTPESEAEPVEERRESGEDITADDIPF